MGKSAKATRMQGVKQAKAPPSSSLKGPAQKQEHWALKKAGVKKNHKADLKKGDSKKKPS